MLLSQWADEINFSVLLEYLAKSCSILFSTETNDKVIMFESMNTFRDILRVLENLKKAHGPKSIIEPESEHIVKTINEQLNYKELFETISPICIDALNEFNSPTQIWR